MKTRHQINLPFEGLPRLLRCISGFKKIGIFLVALAMFLTCPQTVSADLMTGLVAYYPFTGNASDASGKGNNGTVYGGATLTQDRFGNNGSAYQFDGLNDYIKIAHRDYLNINQTTGFTVAAWFKFTGPNYGYPQIDFIDKSHYTDGWSVEADFSRQPQPNALSFFTLTDQGWTPLDGTLLPQDSQWHHLAGTVSGQNLKFYIDGSLKNDHTFAGTVVGNNGDLYLGGNFTLGRYFGGDLDEVRLYSRALSTAEIGQLAAPIPLPSTVLLLGSGLLGILGLSRKFSG